jgi:thymidylate synthase ThyX
MQANYSELLEIWDMDSAHHNFKYKKVITSCLRRIIGLGVATGGVWTGNLRALRHVITLRANEPTAEEEIFHVFSRIGKIMIERERELFGDFKNENGTLTPGYRKV